MAFVPRTITPAMAAEGYNNEGRGELLGYIAVPAKHEESCSYRAAPGEAYCNCRIGLWRLKPRVRVKAQSVRV